MGYIYKITNLINKKIYIGQTRRPIQRRWHEHLTTKDNCPIHIAIQKYGIDNFKIEIIEECQDNSILDEREIYYIKKYDSYNSKIGYNATKGGNNNSQQIIDWIRSNPEQVKNHLDNIRPLALKKFEDNPELKEKREKARMCGYKRYMQEHKEEWLDNQRKKLMKAREILKEQYKENPEEIIKRAQTNGKKASKAVIQLDKDTGQIIQTFESCSNAARYLGKDGGHTNISKACRKGTVSYGFKWAYV